MRIRLVIVDSNNKYADRLVSHLDKQYPERFEIYQFSQPKGFEDFFQANRADVLLMSEDVDIEQIPVQANLAYAYFSDSPSIDTIKSVRTVCRYQNIDLIYKEILNLYAERHTNVTGYKSSSGAHTQLQLFLPVSGGVGATTAACAMAVHAAEAGKKVLYFSLEQCGDTAPFLSGQGTHTLSDVIYAISSNKPNLKPRLESMICTSPQNVDYYPSTAIGLDSLELDAEGIARLLEELVALGNHDVVVFDMDNRLDSRLTRVLKIVDSLVLVGDGSPVSNAKFEKYYKSLKILSEKKKISVENKWKVLYNRFSGRTGVRLEWADMPFVGELPTIQSDNPMAVVLEMAKQPAFDLL